MSLEEAGNLSLAQAKLLLKEFEQLQIQQAAIQGYYTSLGNAAANGDRNAATRLEEAIQ